jgi:hypothetical protein
MAMYSLNLMRIALELAQHNRVYEDIATKFFEHFLDIAEAMNNIGEAGLGIWVRGHRMKCLLRRILDETEFLSDYGVRAISKAHQTQPYIFGCCGNEVDVRSSKGSISRLI